ncbi:RHS repeat domain-containing protein [Microbulbifer echini]|uniref:RHS repeat domain-containing protein n=1 Tax=Microbulbifer echini TaxID=1529067 RepID=A0ABV4NPB1_9GAMM
MRCSGSYPCGDHSRWRRTQYSYNPPGLLAEVTDSEGRSTCYSYDGLSQVKPHTNPTAAAWNTTTTASAI